MTSFYLQTPSGFEIEYGWNGLLVDERSWVSGVIDRPSVWGHHQLDPAHPPGAASVQEARQVTAELDHRLDLDRDVHRQLRHADRRCGRHSLGLPRTPR